jgi:hypothetical protein
MNKLTEKQIEDVFEIFHEELIEKGLTLIERQHIFDNRLRADLLFKDKNGINVVIELKRTEVTRENIGQLFEYHGLFDTPKTRIILAAPFIPEAIRKSFEHFGIEYIEFSLTEIEKLYEKIKDSKKTEIKKETVFIPNTILTRPLALKIKDGNIAFKVIYNDSDWKNACSKDVANYNFKHRTWCKIQSTDFNNCQNSKWKDLISKNIDYPCADSVALRNFSFYPGHYHGPKHNNEAKRCLGAKMNKIAIFTSKEPNANEMDRFIFAIGQIDEIITLKDAEFETINCDKTTGLYFLKNNKPKFWKYYKNPNTDRIAWNTGLFRYVEDGIVRNILEDLLNSNSLTNNEIKNAKYLLEQL